MPVMARYLTPVLHNRPIAEGYYELQFGWPPAAPAPQPGQFLTIRTAESSVPLLRRPFAFSRHDHDDHSARIIYQLRGTATVQLARKRPHDRLDILAPLGHRFPPPETGTRPFLAAGGIGIGPILFLARSLRTHIPEPRLIVGAQNAARLPDLSEEEYGAVITCTEDGSSGRRGTVIDVLRTELSEPYARHNGPGQVLYLCGPEPMLAAGHRLAVERGVAAYVAMEQTMGCAVGACMGCAVRVRGPERYARVCTEGPVFDSRVIDWRE